MMNAHTAGGRVLIIEDDLDIRDALEELLRGEGYEVASAANGREALQVLRAGVNGTPGLILLDLMMPTMNGWEFRAEQLGDQALAEIPVAVLSAVASAEQRTALGATAYIKKPIELDELLAIVERHCRR